MGIIDAGRRQAGLTLVQLIIVLAIVGILAGLAYPGYQEAVRKSKRAEGRAALYQLMQQEERFYSERNTYVEFSHGSTDEEGKKFKWYSGNAPGESAYEIRGEPCKNEKIQNCVVLIASAGTGNVDSNYHDPACTEISLTSTGEKLAKSPECW